MKIVDLFAGIGGLRLGFEVKELDKCVFSSEWDTNSQKTYFTNFNEVPQGDITKIAPPSIPPHDILLAGFPCQAFSVAGYRKGFEDTRGTLFFDIARILDYHRPNSFLLENVKNLARHDKGRTFSKMQTILEDELGYCVHHQVINTMTHANIPQNRERIFIVGFNRDKVEKATSFKFPKPITLKTTIRDLIDTDKKPDKYYYQKTHKYYPKLKKAMTSWDTVYQWRRVYVRENQSNVCPTLTANMGTGGHNVPIILDDYGIRKLTPRECARFQGFPDSFKFPKLADSKLYYQIGNSVTVALIRRIAENIRKIIN
nr:DNA cytosine methyltransferase [Cyanothece sp. BG0011]